MVLYIVQGVGPVLTEGLPGSTVQKQRSQIVSRHQDVNFPEPLPTDAFAVGTFDSVTGSPFISVDEVLRPGREGKLLLVSRPLYSTRFKPVMPEIFQSLMDLATHQKKSLFLIATEEIASTIMRLAPPAIQLSNAAVVASGIYSTRFNMPMRRMTSTLPMDRRNFEGAHVPSELGTPQCSFAISDKMEAMTQTMNQNVILNFRVDQATKRRGILQAMLRFFVHALFDFEVESRFLVSEEQSQQWEIIRNLEPGACVATTRGVQDLARAKAVGTASSALQAQLQELEKYTNVTAKAERVESYTRRKEINEFFDKSEGTLLKPQGVEWVQVEIDRGKHPPGTFFKDVL